jgi:hypothetical protein
LTSIAANVNTGVTALTTAEFVPLPKDQGTDLFPFISLGGPIIKDRAWFFGSYAPQILNTIRTINYFPVDPRVRTTTPVNSQVYNSRQKNEYAFGRIDLQPFRTVRMTGTYLWNPIDQLGQLPAQTTLFDAALPGIANFPGRGPVFGAAFQDFLGGRQSSNNTTGSLIWTPTDRIVVTARGGYSFLNEKLGNYGVPGVSGQLRQLVQVTGTEAPANFGLNAGSQNFPGFSQLLFDVSRRRTFDADASYLVNNFIGRHQFKGGFQFNGISNQIQSTTVDTVVFRFGADQSIESL